MKKDWYSRMKVWRRQRPLLALASEITPHYVVYKFVARHRVHRIFAFTLNMMEVVRRTRS